MWEWRLNLSLFIILSFGKKITSFTIILPFVANRKKWISLKSLEQAKKTLVFPWSHLGLSPDDLSPVNLDAVEIMQARNRTAEEIGILRQEIERLVSNVAAKAKDTAAEQRSWLLNHVIDKTLSLRRVHDFDADLYFFSEPVQESDNEGDWLPSNQWPVWIP